MNRVRSLSTAATIYLPPPLLRPCLDPPPPSLHVPCRWATTTWRSFYTRSLFPAMRARRCVLTHGASSISLLPLCAPSTPCCPCPATSSSLFLRVAGAPARFPPRPACVPHQASRVPRHPPRVLSQHHRPRPHSPASVRHLCRWRSARHTFVLVDDVHSSRGGGGSTFARAFRYVARGIMGSRSWWRGLPPSRDHE